MTEPFDNEFFKGLCRASGASQIKAAVRKRIDAEKERLLAAGTLDDVKLAQGAALVLKELYEALERDEPAPVPVSGISGV